MNCIVCRQVCMAGRERLALLRGGFRDKQIPVVAMRASPFRVGVPQELVRRHGSIPPITSDSGRAQEPVDQKADCADETSIGHRRGLPCLWQTRGESRASRTNRHVFQVTMPTLALALALSLICFIA
jgi:hypothetical protein